ncbi:MAG TPA: hypothetical protein VHF44_02080 [Nitrososphaeraceae archaeon]|nr:hypothetical protein [Nitrososphaeraceae archaeon]
MIKKNATAARGAGASTPPPRQSTPVTFTLMSKFPLHQESL